FRRAASAAAQLKSSSAWTMSAHAKASSAPRYRSPAAPAMISPSRPGGMYEERVLTEMLRSPTPDASRMLRFVCRYAMSKRSPRSSHGRSSHVLATLPRTRRMRGRSGIGRSPHEGVHDLCRDAPDQEEHREVHDRRGRNQRAARNRREREERGDD